MTGGTVAGDRNAGDRDTGRRRLWPATLSGRMALVLSLCLFVAGTVSTGLYIHDRARSTIRLFALSVAGRIDAIVALMDGIPATQREALLPALNSPTLWVRLGPAPPAPVGASWHRVPRLTRMVEAHLPRLRDRITAVHAYGNWRTPTDSADWWDGARPPDLMPSRRKLLISIALEDGTAIAFLVSSDTTSLRWASHVGFWLIVTAVAIVLFSVWAGRRLTRPLRRFAGAADQLGLDVRAPPLPEQGSRELRRATRAFNRMQERIRRLVDDRTMMLAAISHDLRTMLTRLKLRAEFIEDPAQQEKALADIDEMHAMLEATLSFARGDTEMEPPSAVDLAELVRGLCNDVREAGARVDYSGPDALLYRCRPLSLKRALANIIDNAVKYGSEASVSLLRVPEWIEIAIADRGPGIPPEARERVFAPFHRLEPSRSRETGGSGLGLSVARSIVRRHGGDITLDDREGGGLVVHVSLPESTPP